MPEDVLFESESKQRRSEIATYLRTVADSLDEGGAITLRSGERSAPPASRDLGSGKRDLYDRPPRIVGPDVERPARERD